MEGVEEALGVEGEENMRQLLDRVTVPGAVCSAAQYSAFSAVQCSAVQCSAVISTALCSAVQCSAVQFSAELSPAESDGEMRQLLDCVSTTATRASSIAGSVFGDSR